MCWHLRRREGGTKAFALPVPQGGLGNDHCCAIGSGHLTSMHAYLPVAVNVAAPAGERQDEAAEAHDGERGEGQVAAGAEL